ncbi:inositol monophosphatase [Paenibacillus sp. J31TS4]|uniref:inositol monophosphatase family protein n=1 Tax=Paenibacillus sp. J31TS4 TaxID=2807195 RepID=UPI001B173563|nr:inositol monophosphatase [Paenibacillus sp. J31TS4]GIP37660.1 inositol monophosphatase [Paenibacillus sp. J31TS4]
MADAAARQWEKRLPKARIIAEEAAREAAELARSRFENEKDVREKGEFGDLVTAVDLMAEAIILKKLKEAFPDDQIRSEESGWAGVEGDWLWLVDPLDGTNNYAVGLPVYGVAITLLYRKEPVLGVICDSAMRHVYTAQAGRGAWRNGEPLRAAARRPGGRPTLGWIQGHVVQGDTRAMGLKHHLDSVCKRVLRLWAPSLLWAMLARNDLDGIVLFNSEGDDLYAGVLLAKEAGMRVSWFDGSPFEGMSPEPYLIACRPERWEELQAEVAAGLEES